MDIAHGLFCPVIHVARGPAPDLPCVHGDVGLVPLRKVVIEKLVRDLSAVPLVDLWLCVAQALPDAVVAGHLLAGDVTLWLSDSVAGAIRSGIFTQAGVLRQGFLISSEAWHRHCVWAAVTAEAGGDVHAVAGHDLVAFNTQACRARAIRSALGILREREPVHTTTERKRKEGHVEQEAAVPPWRCAELVSPVQLHDGRALSFATAPVLTARPTDVGLSSPLECALGVANE
mmetsp:Transcript_39233/g.111060  ORF Transcript_39233/g.111060 Transcript_39233/m.111060 type:complete len:231 (-) Transcript_39233:100-792(-)